MLKVSEVAEELGCSTFTVIKLIDSGRLKAIDLAAPGARRRALRVTRADLAQFKLESQLQAPPPRCHRPKQYTMKHLKA